MVGFGIKKPILITPFTIYNKYPI